MRKTRSSSGLREPELEQLATEVIRYRQEHRGSPVPLQLRKKAVDLVSAGLVTQSEISEALAVAHATVSRWMAAWGEKSPCRELTLVPSGRFLSEMPPASEMASERASLRLPNGLTIDLPVTAVNATFVAQLLSVSKVFP